MKKTSYYLEIKRLAEGTGKYQSAVDNFFSLCQQYYWKWLIKNNMKSADTVLKYCVDKDEQRVQKKKGKEETLKKENSKERLDLEDKLYLEFLWEIGDRYYPNQNILDIATDIKGESNISKCFTEKPGWFYTGILTIWKKADELGKCGYIWKRQDYSNIHRAMDSARKALDTPVPSIAESVEQVIAQEQLETIKSALAVDRIEIALFTTTPLISALYDGDYRTYIHDDKKRAVYFNVKCEYNFVQLSNYIDSIKSLLSRYDDTMADLESYRKTFK